MDILSGATDDKAFREELRLLMAKHNIVGMQVLAALVSGDMFTMSVMTNEELSDDERNLAGFMDYMGGFVRMGIKAVYKGEMHKAVEELQAETFNPLALDVLAEEAPQIEARTV